jgi:hypothetical protein
MFREEGKSFKTKTKTGRAAKTRMATSLAATPAPADHVRPRARRSPSDEARYVQPKPASELVTPEDGVGAPSALHARPRAGLIARLHLVAAHARTHARTSLRCSRAALRPQTEEEEDDGVVAKLAAMRKAPDDAMEVPPVEEYDGAPQPAPRAAACVGLILRRPVRRGCSCSCQGCQACRPRARGA